MRITRVLAVAAIVAIPFLPVAAQTAAVDRAVSAWAKIRSLKGSFEQTVTIPPGGMTPRGSREIKPNE